MNPEERSLLERTYKIAQENNEMLRKMRTMSRWGTAFRVFYWIVIIGISFGTFYFIQPYIDQVMGVYSGANSSIESMRNFSQKFSGIAN